MAEQENQDQANENKESDTDNKEQTEQETTSDNQTDKAEADAVDTDEETNTGNDADETSTDEDVSTDTSDETSSDATPEDDSNPDDPQDVARQFVEVEEAEKALGVSTSLESIASYMDRNPTLSALQQFTVYQSIRATLSGTRTTPSKVFPSLESYEQEGQFNLTASEIRKRAQAVRQKYQGSNNA